MVGAGPLRAAIPRGFAAYLENWFSMVGVAALIFIPAAVLQGLAFEAIDDQLSGDIVAIALLVAAAVAVSGLGYFFFKGVVTQIIIARQAGVRRPSMVTIARSLPYATLLAVDVLLAVGIAVGLELLIVPGVVFGTIYALAPIVVETEQRGVRDAFRRSRDLVRGEFWVVLTVLFATLALVGSLHWPLELLAGELIADLPEELQEGVAYLLAGILIKPIGAAITVELTLDLASRHPAPALRTPG